MFTVGPLTFRADYVYDGDLESAPTPKFHDAESEETNAAVDDDELEFLEAEETAEPAAGR